MPQFLPLFLSLVKSLCPAERWGPGACSFPNSSSSLQGRSAPMGTSANIITRKGAVSPSGRWPTNFVPCQEARLPRLPMKEDW